VRSPPRLSSFLTSSSSRARPAADATLGWRLLRALAAYRVIPLGLVFLLLLDASFPGFRAPSGHEGFFHAVAGGYLVAVVVLTALLVLHRPALHVHAPLAVGSDLFFLALLTLSGGAYGPEFAIIMLVPAAVGGALFGRRATLVLVLVTIAVVLAQGLLHAATSGRYGSLPFTTILAFGFLLLPLTLPSGAARLREHQSLVDRRTLDVENLETLNAYLVDQIGTGVVVLDSRRRQARRVNRAAELLLGGGDRKEALARLERLRPVWEDAGGPVTIHGHDDRPLAVEPRRLAPDVTLLVLEDLTHIEERIHETKLAALGRLSAAVAHEIRNPLSAIQNAEELLRESARLDGEDRHLLGIIHDQGRRLDGVIRTVLSLSRGESGRTERLELETWLEGFAEEFRSRNRLAETEVLLRLDRELGPYPVRVDPGHLQQILWNLAENALRHGCPPEAPARILLRLTRPSHPPPRAHLGVLDHGAGLEEAAAERIFEPFYTTTSQGTGLGLFIARELSLLNGGRLLYRRRTSGGSEFFVQFPLVS
jgi:two-component system sensor histidine kinase PilS (NtrC family)